jgi:hypothetical protein
LSSFLASEDAAVAQRDHHLVRETAQLAHDKRRALAIVQLASAKRRSLPTLSGTPIEPHGQGRRRQKAGRPGACP